MASKGAVLEPSSGCRFWSARGVTRLVSGRYLLPMELGTRLMLLEQLWVLAHLAARSECAAPTWLDFQSRYGRYAKLPLLLQRSGRNDFACLLLLWPGSPVFESRQGMDGSYRSQTTPVPRHWLDRTQCFA